LIPTWPCQAFVPTLIMHFRCLVLFLFFCPGGARRSIRIDNSLDNVQQGDTFANRLEVSAEAREALIPGGFRARNFYRTHKRAHKRADVTLDGSSGNVDAPSWVLPTFAFATLAFPATLLALSGGKEEQQAVLQPSDSLYAIQPGAFYVDEAGPKGRGLFAAQFIPRGAYLFDYTGDLLTKAEYDSRYPTRVSDDVAGVQDRDGTMYFIDGSDEVRGYPARFMNGSRKPNVRRQTDVTGLQPRILMFALTDIRLGDELQWDYGAGYWDAKRDAAGFEVYEGPSDAYQPGDRTPSPRTRLL